MQVSETEEEGCEYEESNDNFSKEAFEWASQLIADMNLQFKTSKNAYN
jgi:hypothetical protein